jgi:hypothetical protein
VALGDPYVTTAEFKTRSNISGSGDDAACLDAVTAASRWIEHHCRRQFNKVTSATARVFYPTACGFAHVDDFHTTTDLVIKTDNGDDGTFETTWAAADYQLEPLNGVVDGESGWPYYTIRKRSTGSNFFPMTGTGAPLQVTAQWGWNAVPTLVKTACYIAAAEAFRLKDTTMGLGGGGDFGEFVVRRAPHVLDYLYPYRLTPVLVG